MTSLVTGDAGPLEPLPTPASDPADHPDLIIENFTVSSGSTTIGGFVTVSFDVVNIGTGMVEENSNAVVYLSPDATISPTDFPLLSAATTTVIDQGDRQQYSLFVPIEGSIPIGSFFIGAIADAGFVIAESDETNNPTTGTPLSLTGFGPVILDDGSGTLAGFRTIQNAANNAATGETIRVIPTGYVSNPEGVFLFDDDLTLDLGPGITPTFSTDLNIISVTATGEGQVFINGNPNANRLTGTDQNDTLIGFDGADTLDGGDGMDTTDYALSFSRVDIDLAAATATGGQAAGDMLISIETILGSARNDRLAGNSQTNLFNGRDGSDNLNGRGGADTLLGETGMDLISGGSGADSIDGGGEADTLFGNGGGDTILGDAGADTIFGGTGNDVIHGGVASDEISGQGNNDTIHGGTGADIIRGGSGADSIMGDEQSDHLFGNGNNDTLDGGSGADLLQGADGSDRLIGGDGFDTLSGGQGSDRLDGGSGNDTMNGGGSDGARDTFVFLVGYNEDLIVAFDQLGTDRIELDEDLWSGTLTEQQVVDTFGTLNTSGTILTLDFGGGDILQVQNAGGIDDTKLGDDIMFV